jgi:hypothetical protein
VAAVPAPPPCHRSPTAQFMLEIARDPVFYMGDVHDLTKDELR